MTPKFGPALLAASFRRASVHGRTLLARRRPPRDVVAPSCSGVAYPGFTFDQLSTMLAWGSAGRPGLSLSIVTGYMECFEMAVVFRHDEEHERYLAYPTACGTVVLLQHSGARWELPTLDAALAQVLALEQESVDA